MSEIRYFVIDEDTNEAVKFFMSGDKVTMQIEPTVQQLRIETDFCSIQELEEWIIVEEERQKKEAEEIANA